MSMQNKVMEAIRTVAKKQGYEYTDKASYANLGRVYISPPSSFQNILSFYYDFQSSRFSLQFYPGDVEPVGTCGFTNKDCLRNDYLSYSDARGIDAMLAFVRSRLPKIKKPRVKKAAKDDIDTPLKELLKVHMKSVGTDMSGAIRDIMTELIGICGDEQLDADERFCAAFEVFDEEAELASSRV